jgi:hypothetical protein
MIKDIICSRFLIPIICSANVVLLSACSSNLVLKPESHEDRGKASETKYSLVFVIHGDGDYLYHDTSDNNYNADEETLIKAKKAAMENPNAEVFIFHQKPRTNFLLFFPRKDGEFYYYRNGQLFATDSYWRDHEKSNFDAEVEYYNRFHVVNHNKLIKMFLYFGHEIPKFGGAGYDESYPDRTFNIDDLAIGLKRLTTDSSPFDLTILSTCFGGIPYTISKLGSFSKIIISSPENLHLSYFDLSPLESLDISLQDDDVLSFAKRFAQQSFDKLTRSIQTEVSVVVYDVEKVQKFLNSIKDNYNKTLNSLKGMTQAMLTEIKHCDCADIPAYQISTISNGVDVLYRPAKFGRSKNKQSHSGWECWKY